MIQTECYNSKMFEMLYKQCIKRNQRVVYDIIALFLIVLIVLHLQHSLSSISNIAQSTRQMISHLNIALLNINNQTQQLNNNYQRYKQHEDLAKSIVLQLRSFDKKIRLLEKNYQSIKLQQKEGAQVLKQLTMQKRINRLQKLFQEYEMNEQFLENQIKEMIKQERMKTFQEISQQEYFNVEKRRNFWLMERNNMITAFTSRQEIEGNEELAKKQQARLQSVYKLSAYKEELPFCIIVPSFNNAKNFRYQFNLQSILHQDYSNYHIVLIDDASPDRTGSLVKRFLKKNRIDDSRITVIINQQQLTAIPNINVAVTQHCKPNEIGFFVDGDDQLTSRKIFKVYNAVYQSKKPAIAYSLSLEYWMGDNFVKDGWSKPYTFEEKINNNYRTVDQKISHLRSFRIDLYLQIQQKDLKDKEGKWFTSTYDEVICNPMLEMSCGNIQFIEEYFYIYFYGNGYNDRFVDGDRQWYIAQEIKFQRQKYKCNPKFGSMQELIKREKGNKQQNRMVKQ